MDDSITIPRFDTSLGWHCFTADLRSWVFATPTEAARHAGLHHTTILRYEREPDDKGAIRAPVAYVAWLSWLLIDHLTKAGHDMTQHQQGLIKSINEGILLCYPSEKVLRTWSDLCNLAVRFHAAAVARRGNLNNTKSEPLVEAAKMHVIAQPTARLFLTFSAITVDDRQAANLLRQGQKVMVPQGEPVTIVFRVRNEGQQPVLIKALVAGVREPGARVLGWDAPIADFSTVTDLALAPDEDYLYEQTQLFTSPGDYFVEPVWMRSDGHWGGTWPWPRIYFDVKQKQ